MLPRKQGRSLHAVLCPLYHEEDTHTIYHTLQKQDGYFNTKCFTSVACVVTHSCKWQFNGW